MSSEHEGLPSHHGPADGGRQGENAHLDHEDADRLATEHGETDFAGFTELDGEADGEQSDDRSRPKPS